MAGYNAPPSGDYGVLSDALQKLSRRLSELEIPTGTSLNSLVAQVQQAIADIDTTVNASIAANSMTTAAILAAIASPGAIAPGDVTASGNVAAAGEISAVGPLYTPHGRANPVTTSWIAAGINGDGRVAVQPSAIRFKRDVQDYEGSVVEGLHVVTYVMKEDPNATPQIGFIAHEVNDIEPMAVAHEEGEPFALKYDALLGGVVRDLQRALVRIADLEARAS